jgi:hypothetical protein
LIQLKELPVIEISNGSKKTGMVWGFKIYIPSFSVERKNMRLSKRLGEAGACDSNETKWPIKSRNES